MSVQRIVEDTPLIELQAEAQYDDTEPPVSLIEEQVFSNNIFYSQNTLSSLSKSISPNRLTGKKMAKQFISCLTKQDYVTSRKYLLSVTPPSNHAYI